MQYDTFLQRLLELRAQAKSGILQVAERAEYEAAKETYARVLCERQGVTVPAGRRARSALRISALFKLELTIRGATERASTTELSGSGFGVLIGAAVSEGMEVPFKLSLSARDTLVGNAVVLSASRDRAGYRVAFAFLALEPAQAAALEEVLIEAVLPRRAMPSVPDTQVASSPPPSERRPPPSTARPPTIPPPSQRRAPPPLSRPPTMPPTTVRAPSFAAPPPTPPPDHPHIPRAKSIPEMLLDEVMRDVRASQAPPAPPPSRAPPPLPTRPPGSKQGR